MSLVANLVREEQFSDAEINKGLGFGFSFECIVHDGVRFSYFSNLAFMKICASFDEKGEITLIKLDDKFMSYFVSGSQSFVAITKQSTRQTDVHLISTPSVHKKTKREIDFQQIARKFKESKFNYRMYFIFFEFRSERFFFDNVVLPIPSAEADGLIGVNDNKLTLNLNGEIVKWLFQAMKNDI